MPVIPPATPLLIEGARVIDPAARRDEIADLFLDEAGRLLPVPSVLPRGTRRIVARQLIVTPGFLDLHAHFREPGGEKAETLASGSRAAAAGGFTHIVTMPNTSPPCDTPEQVRRQADPALAVRVLPAACATVGRAGRAVADLEALAAAGAVAFTDDGAMVSEPAVMIEALRRARKLDRVVMDHAVLPALAGNGIIRDCAAAHRYRLPVFLPEAEVAAVEQDIQLCRETGARIHIQHISCAAAVAAIRAARQAGLLVSGEASPHHIAIAAEDLVADDGNFRMNPPLGSREDLRALREAVLDGTLTFSSGSIVGVSSFTASVTAVTNGVSTYSGSAIVTNAAILNILSNIPEMTIHGDTVSSVNMKFRSTVNGIELCSGPTPGILAKYDSNVGDTYPIGTTGKVRTVTAKTGLDDYYWGGMYIKVMQVEETPNYSKSTAVTKITYISNHKFGLVGIKVNFDDGTSTTFPFQNTAQNSE